MAPVTAHVTITLRLPFTIAFKPSAFVCSPLALQAVYQGNSNAWQDHMQWPLLQNFTPKSLQGARTQPIPNSLTITLSLNQQKLLIMPILFAPIFHFRNTELSGETVPLLCSETLVQQWQTLNFLKEWDIVVQVAVSCSCLLPKVSRYQTQKPDTAIMIAPTMDH